MPSGAEPGGGVLFSTVGSKGEGTEGAVTGRSGAEAGPNRFQDIAATAMITPVMSSAMAGQRLRDD